GVPGSAAKRSQKPRSAGVLAAKIPAVVLGVTAAVAFSALSAEAAIERVWAVDDGEKVKREDISHPLADAPENLVWDGTTVSLFGALNEVVAFQLIIEGDASGEDAVNVRVTDLTNGSDTIPGSDAGSADPFDHVGKSIELFTQHYLNVTSKSDSGWFYHWESPPSDYYLGWVPDALIPFTAPVGLGGAPFSVPAGENQGVWVDIWVPRDISPGTYTGSIEVTIADAVVQTIPVSLQVYGFAVPDETHLQNMFFYESWGDLCGYAHDHNDDYDAYYYNNIDIRYRQMAHRHRMTLTRHPLDLNTMDLYESRYLNGEAFTPTWDYEGPGEGIGDSSFCIGPYGSTPDEWGNDEAGWRSGSDAWEQWFRDNAPDVYRFHPVRPDEPSPSDYPQVQRECGWLHNNPGIGSSIPCFITETIVEELQGHVDFWCTWGMGLDSSELDLTALEHERSQGHRFGAYNGGRPSMGAVLIDTDAVAFRVIPWVFKKYDIDFYFLWDTTYWQAVNVFQEPATFAGAYNGDGTFFYPGECTQYPEESRGLEGPMSSIRMKNWRRGQQDYEYFWVAEGLGLQTEVSSIIDECVPRAAWEAVPAQNVAWPERGYGFEACRRQLADAIQTVQADTTPPTSPTSLVATAVSDARIDLSWAAATDDESGVVAYVIYRDGVVVGTSAAASYSDTGLDPETTHSYQVLARNGVGLESDLSDSAQATTLSAGSGGPGGGEGTGGVAGAAATGGVGGTGGTAAGAGGQPTPAGGTGRTASGAGGRPASSGGSAGAGGEPVSSGDSGGTASGASGAPASSGGSAATAGGAQPSAGAAGGPSHDGESSSDDSGCGCSVPASRARGTWSMLLAALALFGLRRRRQSAR
ncbi:MAG: DUF4091 domain-containing protein, partial [Polyangiaceae bacterium]|nr:DUF4091 domain-containing protein [Polyangiaceae bacterium]